MIKKLVLVLSLIGVLMAAASCNTIRGAGRDISTAGEAIEEAAGGAP
jgi:predicted small secreted protein